MSNQMNSATKRGYNSLINQYHEMLSEQQALQDNWIDGDDPIMTANDDETDDDGMYDL
eukprot:CAMPEP_0197051082 /NCGR_PEP_ID=MMETSP1384-20130603/25835_1 /TAXON_ID=29189 /ORGANISM="Ammonia sp." /LENGTH=57 /DNA_ID=CAMNT_0042483589 /DNA_START=7 /DNA_END=177 /DNA_ORIENTATION=-